MTLTEGAARLGRYGDIAHLLWKYGRSDIVKRAGLAPELQDEEAPAAGDEHGRAAELADDLEALGPTFVKLGQLLSTRSDLLPPEYLAALSRLQDDVEPVPFEIVERIVEQELGVRLSKAFSMFSTEPIAAASLG
jgi:predicted unusual protein kinase regulating ubiquinone biosynthesis (AarF/ABC1/UbiB family)